VSAWARRLVSLRGRGAKAVLRCHDAQEAVSARLDGERLTVPTAALGAHLDGCRACRDFETDVMALGRRLSLRAPRPAPAELLNTLVAVLEPAPRPRFWSARQWRSDHGPSSGLARVTGWAAAVVPAGLVAVALPLGVGSHPNLVPTRPPTPCTVGLAHLHLQPRG
jgi:hypothetical protein